MQTHFQPNDPSLISEAEQGIYYDAKAKTFHLQMLSSSYVIRVTDDNEVEQLHFGSKITDDIRYIVSDVEDMRNERQFEYANYGNGDFRIPSFRATFEDDGSDVVVFKYQSFEVSSSANYFEDWVPHVRSKQSQSLCIKFMDELKKLELRLIYYVFKGHDILARHVEVINHSPSVVTLNEVNAFSLDLPPAPFDSPYHLTQYSGSWGRERMQVSRLLDLGVTGFESRRGASSAQHNPFFVVSLGSLQENYGSHYAFGLVYSGSHKTMLEVSQNLMLRVTSGIHPEHFSWRLEQGKSFQSPQALLGYSAIGMGPLSRDLHHFIRDSILPGVEQTIWTPTRPRPILVNSWEAMYFNCSEKAIMERLVEPAARIGLDMVVLDDGWFKGRNNDQTSLGDWVVDKRKFPHGLGGLADKVISKGLIFGIWMEPEMISVNSDLYHEHPDWCLHINGRERSEFRNQLVLDLSREDVQDFIVDNVNRVLKESQALYLKWDFNRMLTEVGNNIQSPQNQSKISHMYVLGLYKVWHRITSAHRNVLFESCASGGGRFDLGMLYFTPQVWTSDNSDALARTQIQLGTSVGYPLNSMANHVSMVPNHQLQRTTSFFTRHVVAMSGVLGYELDLLKLTYEETQAIPQYLRLYRHKVEPVVLNGDLYRLHSPFPQDRQLQVPQTSSWIIVNPQKDAAVVFVVLTSFHEVFVRPHHLKLLGLDAQASYAVERIQRADDNGVGMKSTHLGPLKGATLMNAGLVTHLWGDVDSMMFYLTRV